MGWIVFRVFRVVRVPWPNTRTTRNNFGYRGLEPEIGFGFFGFGLFGFGLGFFGLGFRVFCLPIRDTEAVRDSPSSFRDL